MLVIILLASSVEVDFSVDVVKGIKVVAPIPTVSGERTKYIIEMNVLEMEFQS